VPGGRGWWRANALVVILHLQTDGPAQPPGDVQQPLHDELIFLLSVSELQILAFVVQIVGLQMQEKFILGDVFILSARD